MKNKKKAIDIIISSLMLTFLLTSTIFETFAHTNILAVFYDDCIPSEENDFIDEMWYKLDDGDENSHLSHEVTTIKYYFDDNPDTGETWDSARASEIKQAYANSMEKWNNVYFYSISYTGIVTKNKIINVVEGTENDHNLIIYPARGTEYLTLMNHVDTAQEIESGLVGHAHYSEWRMTVFLDHFYVHYDFSLVPVSKFNESYVSLARERTGAHELGHVLGLCDIDDENLCNAQTEEDHHFELLMGYGTPIVNRACDITYKDIAGVAITRGFHTDLDHKWLNMGQQSNGKYKLVCSICNGVKEADSLSGYRYNTYNACSGNHNLSSGNMFAVASYGDSDYYKCKYCRYVAPFSSIVEQNYSKTYYNHDLHTCVNNVSGLQYTFYEEHNIVNGICSGCETAALETHYPFSYTYFDEHHHHVYCECGYNIYYDTHNMVPGSRPLISVCKDCGYQRSNLDSGIIIKGEKDEPVTE